MTERKKDALALEGAGRPRRKSLSSIESRVFPRSSLFSLLLFASTFSLLLKRRKSTRTVRKALHPFSLAHASLENPAARGAGAGEDAGSRRTRREQQLIDVDGKDGRRPAFLLLDLVALLALLATFRLFRRRRLPDASPLDP